ncbi:MAG TPA: hypothetical protein VMZ53_19855 [Kofleriaceae bacterium]|nr:hypothetical protein [Kofleriaceae bacterium]
MKYLLVIALLTACGSHIKNGGDDDDVDSGLGSNGNFPDCDPSTFGGMTCNGNAVVSCNADGTFGQTVTTCGNGMECRDGSCKNACTADGVDLVYVVDEMNDFMSFDPRLLPGDPFHKIGTLSCPHNNTSIQTGNNVAMPFSMSVDRDGVAWVLYTTGELFKVSLQDASCTKANNTIGASSMFLFGMGFALDAPMVDTEKLFLAGGNRDPSTTPRRLGWDDTHGNNLTPTNVGNIAAASDYSPELTGTAEAKLYGFYPRIAQVPFVQEIDKSTGAAVGQTWNVGTTGLGTGIRDWAFAQWGGVFYVFITTETNGVRNSTVRSVDRASSAYKVELQNLPYYIDGAGVSTCAPAVLQ